MQKGTYTHLKRLGKVDRQVSKVKRGVESRGEDRGNWKEW